ncbi:Exo 5'-3' exonuclease (including N-terminal domain of PolI) [uncultured Caudovirales phage]|uniref:Exo 5'-3' exonuclease (Including N-terminal domain of PolI) n=1 Tax=uncultured Caudovirales phage TaxID=2100421 RepID=A0A6J5LEN8_9CAUD|nr:Exo 5'-3' exonuclease (including N-terminal domain of PolI) [uncultured Caudovirales phage]
MRYLLVDFANTFFRSRFIAARQSDDWEKVGFAIHSTLASINKCWRDQKADHVVVCLEGRSWRKSFYAPYKANRAVANAAKTVAEQELDKLFYETFDYVKTFLQEKTNCTVLQHSELEADDLIAGWIQQHPQSNHTIISSDTDYIQLIAPNVNQYNGVTDQLFTVSGVFDGKGKPVLDKKTKEPLPAPNPQWLLFEKCIRGDATDNIFSAYPGVRTKGSKNKVGLQEAYADKQKQGFAWNNLMLSRWTDHNGVEHRVMDDYERNRILIDLAAQPDDIKVKLVEAINAGSVVLSRPMIGAHLMKFCGKYELIKISENAQQYAEWMSAKYIPE